MTIRTKSLQAKASAIEADGNFKGIPGFKSTGRGLDEPPVVLNLGVITFTSLAQSNLGTRPVVPFKATLVGLGYTVLTQAAGGLFNLGSTVSSAKFVSGTPVNTGAAGTFVEVDLSGAAAVDIEAGEALAVGATATAGAVISMVAIVVPRL